MATTFAVPDGRVAMNVVLRNGFGTSGGSITSLNFQPDFFWEKARNNAYNHQLIDSVRGVSKVLYSNLTDAENTQATYVTSFNSNGYTIGANDYGTGVTLVDWCWKAGGTVTAGNNTVGTITSTVSANTTAGFSVVGYTGNGVASTVGHGLGVVPSMIITKCRSSAGGNWPVYHVSFGNTGVASWLNTDYNSLASIAFWNNTSPTNTVFSIGTNNSDTNNNGQTMIAYCWAPVAGYSAFGSYVGNASTDGPFVYTGFRPQYVLVKRLSGGAGNWLVYDKSRIGYNQSNSYLLPDLSNAEGSGDNYLDMLSNGFKVRVSNQSLNVSGSTYMYACFAENPLKYANAR